MYERISEEVQLVAIAGIATGSEVSVRIESVRPLDRFGTQLGALTIALGDDAGRVTPSVNTASASTARATRHEVVLSVRAEGMNVTVNGRAEDAALGRAIRVRPAPRMTIGFAAAANTMLDGIAADGHVEKDRSSSDGAGAHGESPNDPISLRALALPELSFRKIVASPPPTGAPPTPLASTLPESFTLIKPGA